MSLFESKEERLARARTTIRKGQSNIRRYIQNCGKTRDNYRQLAKRSLALGDEKQAGMFVRNLRYYEEQENRWSRFLLKLEDVVLRGEAVGAIGDLMRSVQQVCQIITKDISLKEVAATAERVQVSMDKVGQMEDTVGQFMQDLEIPAGDSALSQSDMSEEDRAAIAPLLDSLRQEVVAEAASSVRAGGSRATTGAGVAPNLEQELERLRQMRRHPAA